MDKHVLHNILHKDAGNSSQNCAVCNGSIKMDDQKAMMTKANEILSRRQSLGMMYSEEEKELIKFNADNKEDVPMIRSYIDVMTFSEKGKVPSRIKVLPIGEIDSPIYGKVKITKEIIDDMVKHFNEDVRASSSKTGLPIDYEHGTTEKRDAAGGWMKKLFSEKDGLYAETEWTSMGKKDLEEGVYKFISPGFYLEGYRDPETGKEYANVMTGAGLVNKPGMPHSLPPLVYSEQKQNTPLTQPDKSPTIFVEIKKLLPDSNMDIKQILAKEKTARSSEEQAFLAEHKEELTFAEAKKEGFAADPTTETPKAEAAAAKPGEVVMSEAEVKGLRDQAEKGEKAFKELEREKTIKEVRALVFVEGKGLKLPVDQIEKAADLLLTMSEEHKKIYKDQLAALPTQEIFAENGGDNAVKFSENPRQKLHEMTEAQRAAAKKDGKEMTYSEAQDVVIKENPSLVDEAYKRD